MNSRAVREKITVCGPKRNRLLVCLMPIVQMVLCSRQFISTVVTKHGQHSAFGLVMLVCILFYGSVCHIGVAFAGIKVDKKIKFEPIDTVARFGTDFPYEAEFRFKELPVVGDSAHLVLRLKAKRDLEDTVKLYVRVLPNRYVELGVDEITWSSPRRNKSIEVAIPLRFLMGGNYVLLFEQPVTFGKRHTLYALAISFGVDGSVIYFGTAPSPIGNCPGNFYTRNMDRIRIQRKSEFKDYRRSMGLPFDVDLTIAPIPRLNETSNVEFRVITNSNFIHDVQFQFTHSPTMTLDSIPRSWGGRPRVGGSFRGAFQFKPRFPGPAVIEFRVFGKDIYSKLTGKSEIEIPVFMVFDSSGALLYLGETNIFDCNFSENDRLREQLETVFKFDRGLPVPRIVRSQPDYEAIERREKIQADSSQIDPAVVDSVMKTLKERGED